MRILLVSEFFPPENAIASHRIYSFAKYWHQTGHGITVLTTLKNSKNNNLNLNCEFINIIRLPIPFLSNPSISNQRTEENSKNNASVFNELIKIFLNILKKIYFYIADTTGCFSSRFPNFSDLWAKKSIKLINPFEYDIILSSGGPYSVHRVGLALKKKNPKIKWIVDWRDLWTKNPIYKGFLFFYPYELILEKIFHRNADLITTVSDPPNRTLSKMTKTCVKTIYNGFDHDDFANITFKDKSTNDTYNIVYTGSFYHKLQDPSPLFEAIAKIKKKDIVLYKKIEIIFAGPNSDISNIASKYDVLDAYSYLGFIKHAEALELQNKADAVLFIDYRNTDGMLTGKLFEYINVSKKIIAIGDNDASSAVELIKKTNTGIFLGNDANFIAEYLTVCLNNKNEDVYKKNDAVISEYTREHQAKQLMNYIMEL